MKIITKQLSQEIKQLLSDSKKITIIGHYAPDGDAVGSSLALYNLFKKYSYDISVVMPSFLPDYLKMLPASDKIIVYSKEDKKAETLLSISDTIICVDFNSTKRVGKLEKALLNSKAVKIMLDHHPEPENFVDYIISNTEASSASEIIYEFIVIIGMNNLIDKTIATCLYTGIMTDTINFSVNSSRKRTFDIVGNLLELGIDKDKIYSQIFNNYSADRMRLAGYVLNKKMKILYEHNTAYIILNKKELMEYNYKNGDHEGFVNFPLSIKEINVTHIFIEKDDYIKTSSRSTSNFDVNKFARKYFNGGGHKKASGGKLFININEVENYILNAIKNID